MSFGSFLDRLCTSMVWTNNKIGHKDAYTTTFTKPILSLPGAYETHTRKRSSTNHEDHKKNLSNNGMENGGACRAMDIKDHNEF